MPYKHKETYKVYWTIGEVAKMVHQATSAIRFWETEFPWLSPKKGKRGNRKYTREDLAIVIDINFLLNVIGMTIKGVRQAYDYEYMKDFKMIVASTLRKTK